MNAAPDNCICTIRASVVQKTGARRPQLLFSFSSWGARHQGLGNRRVKAIELPQPTSRHLGAPMASQPASLSTSSRWGCPSAQSLRVQKEQKWLTGRPCKQLSTSVLVGVGGASCREQSADTKKKRLLGAEAGRRKGWFFISNILETYKCFLLHSHTTNQANRYFFFKVILC